MINVWLATPTQSQTGKQEPKLAKTEATNPTSLNISHGPTDLSVKPDNVKIKGLQANVSIPKVRAMTPSNDSPPLQFMCKSLLFFAADQWTHLLYTWNQEMLHLHILVSFIFSSFW